MDHIAVGMINLIYSKARLLDGAKPTMKKQALEWFQTHQSEKDHMLEKMQF
tara:strand:- start:700 stop:852 length:153 start_codon:yes stop_codon:yes gene_type:complete